MKENMINFEVVKNELEDFHNTYILWKTKSDLQCKKGSGGLDFIVFIENVEWSKKVK